MSLNDFCCHGWHLRSLVCLLDLVTRCRIGVICDWHDLLLTGSSAARRERVTR